MVRWRRVIQTLLPASAMRFSLLLIVAAAVATTMPARAQDVTTACQMASTYDLTLRPDAIVFDRPDGAPRQVRMHDGALWTDGRSVSLRPDEQDRAALFESRLRDLVPRAKALASDGVDVAARAVRDEAATASPASASSGELDRVLARRVAEIKQRIAASQSTRDWQEDAMRDYAQQIVSDIMPLLTQDVGGEAMQMAMNGDLQGAAALRDRVSGVASGAQSRVVAKVTAALRPRAAALCPAVRQLEDLQSGLRDANGRPLMLLEAGG